MVNILLSYSPVLADPSPEGVFEHVQVYVMVYGHIVGYNVWNFSLRLLL